MTLSLFFLLPFFVLSHQSVTEDDCYCGLTKDCEENGDSMLGFTQGVGTQCQCETLCLQNPSCNYYTWFDNDDPTDEARLCIMFSYCVEEDHWDSYRHTCP